MSPIEQAVRALIAPDEQQRRLDLYEMLTEEGKRELLALLQSQAK